MAAWRSDSGSCVNYPDPVPIDLPDDYDDLSEPLWWPPAHDGDVALVVSVYGSRHRRSTVSHGGLKAYLLRGFLVAFLVLCLVAGVMIRVASAQQPGHPVCGDAAELAKALSKKYGETPVAFGLLGNGNMLQLYSSEAKDTWTAVLAMTTGQSCIIASGRRFEMLPVGEMM